MEDLLPGPEPSGKHYLPRVHVTPDFVRIHRLPRRVWQADPRLPRLTQLMTDRLRTPSGKQTLFPIQAQIMLDAWRCGGAFVQADVGEGKTIPSVLTGAFLDLCQSRPIGTTRNMLLIPGQGQMRAKTRDEVREYGKHWQIPPVTILTYEQISQERRGEDDPSIIERYRPEFIFCDEAGALANTSTAIWRTLSRYVRTYKPRIVFADATYADDTLKQFWHLLRHALGPERAPVPGNYHEMNLWCGALDVTPREPSDPGALDRLSELTDTEKRLPEQRRARVAFRRRLVETPGVVISDGTSRPKAGLSIACAEISTRLPPQLGELIERMRAERVTPGGEKIKYALELWRYEQQLAQGFYQVFDPEPPRWWSDPRRDLNDYVAKILSHSTRFVKPSQVIWAIDAGRLPDGADLLQAWRDVRDEFVPNPVPVWVDDTPLRHAADWLTDRPTGALVWTQHRAAGERLSARSGVPFFASQGVPTNSARFGKKRVDKWQRSAIVSLSAIWKGFNLQKHHHQNLYIDIPTKAKRWQQSIGRTHRHGQARDVTVEVWLATDGHRQALTHAIARATYVQDKFAVPQKLLYANSLLPESILDQARGLALGEVGEEDE